MADNDIPPKFKVGEIVYLKSGSPKLAVSWVSNYNDGYAIMVNWITADGTPQVFSAMEVCFSSFDPALTTLHHQV